MCYEIYSWIKILKNFEIMEILEKVDISEWVILDVLVLKKKNF